MAIAVVRYGLGEDRQIEKTEICTEAESYDEENGALLLIHIEPPMQSLGQRQEEATVVKIYAPGAWISAEVVDRVAPEAH